MNTLSYEKYASIIVWWNNIKLENYLFSEHGMKQKKLRGDIYLLIN